MKGMKDMKDMKGKSPSTTMAPYPFKDRCVHVGERNGEKCWEKFGGLNTRKGWWRIVWCKTLLCWAGMNASRLHSIPNAVVLERNECFPTSFDAKRRRFGEEWIAPNFINAKRLRDGQEWIAPHFIDYTYSSQFAPQQFYSYISPLPCLNSPFKFIST